MGLFEQHLGKRHFERNGTAITGPLDEPDTGILFTVPVTRARGLHRRSKP